MRTLLLCVAVLLAGQQTSESLHCIGGKPGEIICDGDATGIIVLGPTARIPKNVAEPPPLAVPAKKVVQKLQPYPLPDGRWIVEHEYYECENPDYFLLTNGKGESLCVDVKRLVGYVGVPPTEEK